jgi:hypothetical protein
MIIAGLMTDMMFFRGNHKKRPSVNRLTAFFVFMSDTILSAAY